MPLSDEELIEKVRAGGRRYYGPLIDRHRDRGFTLAIRMLRNREDAEEALQDAFMRAYRGLDAFEGNSTFGTWFYRILYNVCLSRIGRRENNVEEIEYDEDRPSEVPLVPEYESKELTELLYAVIDALPQKYRTVLSLFYLQDLTYDEIAGVTQLPLGTVKVQLLRARALLRERWNRQYPAERASA